MEREMEILRLEEENKALRELLAIAEETNNAVIPDEGVKDEDEEIVEGFGAVSRKNSLTIEELEAGAEAEEMDRERMGTTGEAGLVKRKEGEEVQSNGVHVEAGGPKENAAMKENVLGFSPDATPPEEAIDDGAD
jgi:hypothetical protein